MKKGQFVEGVIEEIAFPNKGKMTVTETVDENGKKVERKHKITVKGTLPGQKVRGMINKKKGGKCEARLEEVLCKSPMEDAEPVCALFGSCGGCTYQTLSYEHQLQLKESQVRKLLEDVCDLSVFEGILGSPCQWGYRNKMEFSFGDGYKDGPLELGLHKKGSFYDILTTNQCKIVQEDYNQILKMTLEYFRELQVDFYHKMTHQGYLRHLLIRRGVKSKEITVNLVTSTQEHTRDGKNIDLTPWVEQLKELPLEGKIVGITHIYNDSLSDVVQSDRTEILFGQDYLYEELLGLKFKVSTFSFFQTNSLGAEVLYQKAREYVLEAMKEQKEKEYNVIYDLYSGTGTIAQMLSPVAQKVVGVEIIEEAVQAAAENAALNGLTNCEFIAGDVLKVIDELEDKPDFIVLDPPRDGIHPKALRKIIDFQVDKIIYISCKPTSLARDLAVFKENGYQVEKACAVDQFPGTVHVETVILLSRKAPDAEIKVRLDMSELDITSAESKATYKEIQEYVKNKYDLHVTNLYIAQVKREFGIIERENYNTGEGKAKVPQVTAEKREAIIDALKYFQMIE